MTPSKDEAALHWASTVSMQNEINEYEPKVNLWLLYKENKSITYNNSRLTNYSISISYTDMCTYNKFCL